MRLAAYPMCCGIHILEDFGNNGDYGINIREQEDTVKRLIAGRGVGLYLAAINHIQKKHYAKMMERLGFTEMVADFYHPGHGHTISLYGYIVHGANMKPDVVPRKTKDSIFQLTTSNYW